MLKKLGNKKKNFRRRRRFVINKHGDDVWLEKKMSAKSSS